MEKDATAAAKTLATQDVKRKTKDAKVSVPTETGVEEAKEWVDEHEV